MRSVWTLRNEPDIRSAGRASHKPYKALAPRQEGRALSADGGIRDGGKYTHDNERHDALTGVVNWSTLGGSDGEGM